ncbi:MAG: hypothetical protein VYE73_08200 [Acidobacteriota bacterium]|nr:hypothetical protein [Acidobacteriota bacterium]
MSACSSSVPAGHGSSETRPAFEGPRAVWARRLIKALLVVFIGLIPLGGHAIRQIGYLRAAPTEADPRGNSLLMNRGFCWISQVPFNR